MNAYSFSHTSWGGIVATIIILAGVLIVLSLIWNYFTNKQNENKTKETK